MYKRMSFVRIQFRSGVMWEQNKFENWFFDARFQTLVFWMIFDWLAMIDWIFSV